MVSQSLGRSLFLAGIASCFLVYADEYPVGTLASAGPGLFPMAVAGLLLLLAVAMWAQDRLAAEPPVALSLRAKNIGLILAALLAFVLCAKTVSTLLGILLLVVIAGFAARTPSWRRNALVCLGLVGIAWAFERFLGLNLRLWEWRS